MMKLTGGALSVTQSLRNKWIETGLKKVDLRKVNPVSSKKIKKPEKHRVVEKFLLWRKWNWPQVSCIHPNVSTIC